MSNFPCSLTKNITSHSMKNLAFHRLLRWKMIIPQTPTYIFLFKRLGERTFRPWEVEGLIMPTALLKTESRLWKGVVVVVVDQSFYGAEFRAIVTESISHSLKRKWTPSPACAQARLRWLCTNRASRFPPQSVSSKPQCDARTQHPSSGRWTSRSPQSRQYQIGRFRLVGYVFDALPRHASPPLGLAVS